MHLHLRLYSRLCLQQINRVDLYIAAMLPFLMEYCLFFFPSNRYVMTSLIANKCSVTSTFKSEILRNMRHVACLAGEHSGLHI